MTSVELENSFVEGRLSRRAFVRQLIERGMAMPDALSYADSLVPAPAERAGGGGATQSGLRHLPFDMSLMPARVADIDISFGGEGYLIYQPAQDQMHSLNHTGTIVLELCTGENTGTDIARLLQRFYELPEPPIDETQRCLTTFREGGLID